MSRLKALRTVPPQRCSQEVMDKQSRIRWAEFQNRPIDLRCQLTASFEVDGKPVCRRHAEKAAMEILLSEKKEMQHEPK